MSFFQIDTYDQYRQLSAGKRILNNGFTPQEIQKYIARGGLYASEFPVFLYDEVAYYQMCLASVDVVDLTKILEWAEKPVICYVRQDGKNAAQSQDLCSALEQTGFEPLQLFYEVERLLPDEVEAVALDTSAVRFKQTWCLADYARVLALWRKGIPNYELPFMTANDVFDYAKNGRLLALEDVQTGELIAVNCFDNLLGRSLEHHIVVDENYRGCGYASTIIKEWMAAAKAMGARKAWAWIAETNLASLKLHEKAGFSKTAVQMRQYIKKEK